MRYNKSPMILNKHDPSNMSGKLNMINVLYTHLRAFCKNKPKRKLSLLFLFCFCFCSCGLLYKSGYVKSHNYNISELYDIELKEYNLIYLDPKFVLVLKKDDKERASKITKKKIEYDSNFCAVIQIEQLSFNLSVAPGPGYIEFSEKKISLDPADLIFIFIDTKYHYNIFQNNSSLKIAINNYIEYQNQTNENVLLNILVSLP